MNLRKKSVLVSKLPRSCATSFVVSNSSRDVALNALSKFSLCCVFVLFSYSFVSNSRTRFVCRLICSFKVFVAMLLIDVMRLLSARCFSNAHLFFFSHPWVTHPSKETMRHYYAIKCSKGFGRPRQVFTGRGTRLHCDSKKKVYVNKKGRRAYVARVFTGLPIKAGIRK